MAIVYHELLVFCYHGPHVKVNEGEKVDKKKLTIDLLRMIKAIREKYHNIPALLAGDFNYDITNVEDKIEEMGGIIHYKRQTIRWIYNSNTYIPFR